MACCCSKNYNRYLDYRFQPAYDRLMIYISQPDGSYRIPESDNFSKGIQRDKQYLKFQQRFAQSTQIEGSWRANVKNIKAFKGSSYKLLSTKDLFDCLYEVVGMVKGEAICSAKYEAALRLLKDKNGEESYRNDPEVVRQQLKSQFPIFEDCHVDSVIHRSEFFWTEKHWRVSTSCGNHDPMIRILQRTYNSERKSLSITYCRRPYLILKLKKANELGICNVDLSWLDEDVFRKVTWKHKPRGSLVPNKTKEYGIQEEEHPDMFINELFERC